MRATEIAKLLFFLISLLCCLCETALKTRLDISFAYLFKQLDYYNELKLLLNLWLFCFD